MKDKKRKIVDKFHAIKDELKQKGKYSDKERVQIEHKIAKHLKVSRSKIYKWKIEFDLSRRIPKNERKILVEKFDQMKAELTRDGFKNSYKQEIDKNVAKELGLSFSTDQLGQIEPNSTDQIAEDEQKHKIIDKFLAMKDEFKQKGKFLTKEWVQIEKNIAKHLKVNRTKIYKWKKEFGLSRKVFNEKEERKHLIEKFDQKKVELTRAGIKNSYQNEINESVAKDLGLSFTTIYNWKRKLGQTAPTHKHSDSEQKTIMKRYYEIKDNNPKSDEGIAKILKIGTNTLIRWKRQFKRQQLHPNSVDGHFVEEYAGSNIENSNSD